MVGTLALVGAGEFLDTMSEVDGVLLARAGGRQVVVLPTASAPDGPGVPERWARMGVEHFTKLGAQVDALLALDRADCDKPAFAAKLRRAQLVYFSGGKPDYLLRTLEGTALWEAVRQVLAEGGVVAGCSAGAMIMGAYVPAFSFRLGVPSVNRWDPAFALVPDAVIAPHYNEFPQVMHSRLYGSRPPGTYLIGIDAHTALVGYGDAWEVMGRGSVTVRAEAAEARFEADQKVDLETIKTE